MKKIAIIGDIVSSRKISNRRLVQNKLSTTFKDINKNNPHIISPYTITLGDEFQALYSNATLLFYNLISILNVIHPTAIRYSIAVGDIDTQINREMAIGMDGSAFHNARNGINKLKTTTSSFRITGIGPPFEIISNLILDLISPHSHKWKKNRLDILALLCTDQSVEQMSIHLKKSEQAIYKAIETGHLRTIKGAFESVEDIINQSLKDK